MARQVTLRSPLDPVALATTLQAAIPARIDASVPAQVIGTGSDQELTLWWYRPRRYNDLACRLVATIDPAGNGSVIAGRIGTPTAGLVFLAVWLAFVGALFIAMLIFVIMLRPPLVAAAAMIGLPGIMIAFGALFGWLATRHAAEDEAAIRRFLAQTVHAR